MLMSATLGTGLGAAAGALVVGVALLTDPPAPRDLSGLLVFVGFFFSFWLPGLLLSSILVSLALVGRRRAGCGDRTLRLLSPGAGLLLGVANIFLANLLLDLHFSRSVYVSWPDPIELAMGVFSGLGLGLGCFWGLPHAAREER